MDDFHGMKAGNDKSSAAVRPDWPDSGALNEQNALRPKDCINYIRGEGGQGVRGCNNQKH